MLTKTIEFVDFNGNKRKENHYFNLTKSEIMKMEMSTKGGLTEMINNVISAQDTPAILKIFEDLVEASYGRKDADGRGFVKSKEIFNEFKFTNAYDELFIELISDPQKAADFFNGLVPADLAEKVKEEMDKQQLTTN